MQITKDTVIGSILDEAPDTAPFFLEMGMHCLGCPASRGETVEMACMVHGVNADELIAKINFFFEPISFSFYFVLLMSALSFIFFNVFCFDE